MHDSAHITVILDIVASVWLIDFCQKATKSCGLGSRLRNFMAHIKISLRNAGKHQRSDKEMVNDPFPG